MNSRVLSAPGPSIAARRDFQTLLRHRELQLSAINRSFTVIGHGSVGAKAEQLMQKAWAIEQAGFAMNPRVVLAMGFFDDFLIHNGWFSKEEMRIFGEIAKRFKDTPLAVRSSAHRDCRGTGTYRSTFCLADAEKIAKAIREVLYSGFSRDAEAFRNDTNLPGGMAVIIEPVFGEKLEPKYADEGEMLIAPQYSGLAYTSTSWGKCRIQLVAGMPTKAVEGDGFIVEGDCANTFDELLWKLNDIHKIIDRDHRAANHDWLRKMPDWRVGTGISLLDGHERELAISRTSIGNLSASWLSERLRALEQLLGKPQYVEFALAAAGGKPKAAILQIADMEISRDFFEFSETKNIVARSNMVVGSGQRVCEGLVFVWNPDDIYLLSEYNREHRNYIVVYGGGLASSIFWPGRIGYSDLSNSAVIVEKYEMTHTAHPIAHFEGMMQQSGKLFMVTDVPDWDKLEKFKRTITEGDNRLEIYDAKFRVTASERQQRGIIELIED